MLPCPLVPWASLSSEFGLCEPSATGLAVQLRHCCPSARSSLAYSPADGRRKLVIELLIDSYVDPFFNSYIISKILLFTPKY